MEQQEWYELLRRKLLPQLDQAGFLVIAVVGGTNIGKSAIFNHLAGSSVSAVSPMASGTKHPTAILSPDLARRIALQQVFPGFQVQPAIDPAAALEEDAQHRLYFREDPRTPANLIVLDTPDVDSVARVNWERADALRQSADLLLAVLTQQKYNDAAVKQFFRMAAEEGKEVIVVFNQAQLPEDEQYWPLWLETFIKETGISPLLVYLAPYDRAAAQENRLPFFERDWPLQGRSPSTQPRHLMRDLADLKFHDIKRHALRGAMQQVLSPEVGLPGWLAAIRSRAGEFQEALDLMASRNLVEMDHWPTLPAALLIEQIRAWWGSQREGWTATVHGLYNRLGQAVAAPVHYLRRRGTTQPEDPWQAYRAAEWMAVLEVLERTLDRLAWLRDLGHPLLAPRLNEALGGASRAELMERLRQAHAQVDFPTEVRELVHEQLHKFRDENPSSYRLFRRIDSVAAATRPAISVALFLTGAGPLGHALAPAATDAALQTLLHVAGDAVGGTVVTAVGDKLLTDTAGTGAGYLEVKFRQLHAAFVQRRTAWMAKQLEGQLLGNLPDDLRASADVVHSAEFQQVRQLTEAFRDLLSQPALAAAGE